MVLLEPMSQVNTATGTGVHRLYTKEFWLRAFDTGVSIPCTIRPEFIDIWTPGWKIMQDFEVRSHISTPPPHTSLPATKLNTPCRGGRVYDNKFKTTVNKQNVLRLLKMLHMKNDNSL